MLKKEEIPDQMPRLPTRITVQVFNHDFGPTNIRVFGVSFKLLVGKDVGLGFHAGGGNRRSLVGHFQATLPDDFNLLPEKTQMEILYSQVSGVGLDYYCRNTESVRHLSPENFERTAWYGNTIEF